MHAELGLLHSRIFSAKVCFLHGMVPRGATVRARTEVDAIAIPPSAAWRMCSVLKDPGKCMKIALVSLAVVEQHSVLSASARNVTPKFLVFGVSQIPQIVTHQVILDALALYPGITGSYSPQRFGCWDLGHIKSSLNSMVQWGEI